MSKKVFFLSFYLLISATALAQRDRVENLPTFDKRKLHYGFYLGVNQNDFKLNLRNSNISNANITVEPSLGFNVGLIADLRLHENLNLRFEPGLVTNSKNIYFNHIDTAQDSVREIGSTYLHVPVILKFSTDRYKNIRPYVLAGVSYDYNFSSNEENQDDNSAGQFRMQSHNFMYEVGMGIDIYLNFFKFSPSIRGVFAFNNEIKYDDNPNSQWTAPVNFMGSRGIFLNFAFE
ncbi:porin family protein [Polaribacter dokdonensis]|uniref:PorT protein n=1 Tax=Polaribacter dokdonensis DSW-5 TaxID=1300348 RepID=A0A0M9CF00_9FLAO|nr:porin family protein [Polaribacter dokdonensis]KOY51182.1 PorT protein [Polaribacter dokdonensis DSW-5]SEE16925.1 probable protein-translocating porin PorT [Polaribacter dokdonensis DSW-5]